MIRIIENELSSTNSRGFDKTSEFIDYGINDGEGYVRTYYDIESAFNNDPDLQEDFESVDDLIQAMLDTGELRIFHDISDEEYDYYFGEDQ